MWPFWCFRSKRTCRLFGSKKTGDKETLYLPWTTVSDERIQEKGLSYTYLAKLWVINRISLLIVKWSDVVLLPSKKAVDFYKANPSYKNAN